MFTTLKQHFAAEAQDLEARAAALRKAAGDSRFMHLLEMPAHEAKAAFEFLLQHMHGVSAPQPVPVDEPANEPTVGAAPALGEAPSAIPAP